MGWKALRAACCLLSISCATAHFFRQKACDTKRRSASGRRETAAGIRRARSAAEITVKLEHCRWANCESVVLDIFIPYRVCCGSRSSDVAVDFLDEASSI